MKKILTLFISIIAINGFAQNAGNPAECDSVDIVSVQFNPFDMNQLLVYVENNNQLELFSYPGFKLTNTQGDTVAEETVNLFGIGQESLHQLNTSLTGYLPGDVFDGQLYLYTGFYDSLRCVFPVSDVLVPDGGCSEFYISTTDWSENISQSLYWSITDEQGTVVESGEHDHTSTEYTLYDTVCLPNNNCYTLNITANNSLEGNSDIRVNYSGFWLSEGTQMAQGSTQYSIDFSVYYCDSLLSVGESELDLATVQLMPNPASERLNISWEKENSFHTLDVFDLAGKLVLTTSIEGKSNADISLATLQNGVYMVRLSGESGIVTKKLVKNGR